MLLLRLSERPPALRSNDGVPILDCATLPLDADTRTFRREYSAARPRETSLLPLHSSETRSLD